MIATVTRCAAVLKEIWAKEIAAEQVNREEIIPLAANLASAYRYAGDDPASADVLDQTMAKAGKDPTLLRARALLYLHADEDRKAVELLTEGKADPEAQLFAAQVLASKEPDRALERLDGVDPTREMARRPRRCQASRAHSSTPGPVRCSSRTGRWIAMPPSNLSRRLSARWPKIRNSAAPRRCVKPCSH